MPGCHPWSSRPAPGSLQRQEQAQQYDADCSARRIRLSPAHHHKLQFQPGQWKYPQLVTSVPSKYGMTNSPEQIVVPCTRRFESHLAFFFIYIFQLNPQPFVRDESLHALGPFDDERTLVEHGVEVQFLCLR